MGPIILSLLLLAVGALLYVVYNLQRLKTKEELMQAAIKTTGYKDFGFDKNPKWLEGFELTLSETRKANLKIMGRMWMNFLFSRRLAERLKFVHYVANHPELQQVEIKNPWFIIGLPRTGSTITYNLLALDGNVRTLKLWELFNPTPAPSDPTPEGYRIRRLARALAFHRFFSPGIDKIHYTRALHPEEETFWFSQNNWFPGLAMGVVSQQYQDWFLQQEDKSGDAAVPIYEDFKNMLRMRTVQSGTPDRWVFKGVLIHQHVLPALFRVFPDARVIYLRRDPVEAVGSAASLETAMGAQFQGFNLKSYGPKRLPMLLSLETSTQNYRRSLPPELERKRFVDLLYKNTVLNPYDSIKKAYDHFGLDFTEEYSAKIKRYMAENPKGKHGKHHYNLKTYGLTDEGVREAFAPVYGDSLSATTTATVH